ncbi:Mismatch repair endonuclease PMS2 [Gracilariopsis chorda]|uniref:Mismatch repair endonuclease PMS2 n=1 Tax=Gracilariopsis chorda TaxID=448386 RepID=A0A2V3IUW2_9FLOR|nr:Mismatch repair endonuclease PMS2 [Gracilariopsis chorda]|eukprot:PXF45487.1 Mismatch repair endonuclease PMS2 [Gracilariopsis chorda]
MSSSGSRNASIGALEKAPSDTPILPGRLRIAHLQNRLARSIRAAQTLLDPAAIIKELLENALDAGATHIDLRIRGTACLSSIVSADNGSGVPAQSLPDLCRPSTTSKLSNVQDLERINTYGFRGEALSAICGIARRVSITTRTRHQPVAQCAHYGTDGSLLRTSPAARSVGTTVQVEDVFHSLPVRKKDALAHPSRQLARCVAVVQAAALISEKSRIELRVGTDLKVANSPLIVQRKEPEDLTQSSLAALQRNAVAVLGRSANNLVRIYGCVATIMSSGASPQADAETKYHCYGLISSASLNSNGSGRARSSHQYVYINRRPVSFPQLVRAATELYRRATGLNGASPLLLVNLTLPSWTVDANLGPDKRNVAIYEEEKLVQGVVDLLTKIWFPTHEASIPLRKEGTLFTLTQAKYKPGSGYSSTQKIFDGKHVAELKRDRTHPLTRLSNENPQERIERPINASPKGSLLISEHDRPSSFLNDIPDVPCFDDEQEPIPPDADMNDVAIGIGAQGTKLPNENEGLQSELRQGGQTASKVAPIRPGSAPVPQIRKETRNHRQTIRASLLKGLNAHNVSGFIAKRSRSCNTPKKRHSSPLRRSFVEIEDSDDGEEVLEKRQSPPLKVDKPDDLRSAAYDAPRFTENPSQTAVVPSVAVDWDTIRDSYATLAHCQRENRDENGRAELQGKSGSAEFKDSSLQTSEMESGASTHQDLADKEISRLFCQDWFKHMTIIGQFNRGFIIARHGADLFIIDQHASDEKYNFEELESTTVISQQRLVRPMLLDFSAEDELIVQQHIHAFKAGGFDICYNAERRPTQRLLLKAQPASKHTIFVREDLQDMVDLLKSSSLHGPGTRISVLRPPRVRAMLASRACRKSIMIGTALSHSQMGKVVCNLATIKHPWTCPHGRPTMRHLCVLP